MRNNRALVAKNVPSKGPHLMGEVVEDITKKWNVQDFLQKKQVNWFNCVDFCKKDCTFAEFREQNFGEFLIYKGVPKVHTHKKNDIEKSISLFSSFLIKIRCF